MTHRPIASRRRSRYLLFALPVLAVCLSVLFFWPQETLHESQIFLNLEAAGLPTGLTIRQMSHDGIEVHVRGSRQDIENLIGLGLKYPVDLGAASIGAHTVAIDQEHIPVPPGIEIDRVSPSELTILVEKEIQKSVPLSLTLTGKPAKGFSLADAAVQPAQVTLTGPESLVSPLARIETKPLDIDGFSESMKREVALDIPPWVVVAPPAVFTAVVSIKEMVITRRLADIPVIGKNTDHSHTITPGTITIEVLGPATILENLEGKDRPEISVDLKGLAPGVYVRRAAIVLPVKTTLQAVEPELFTVEIKSP